MTNEKTPQVRNAQAEANALFPSELRALVAEPSPPTVTEGPWFADDPIVSDSANPGAKIVTIAGGDLTWDQVVAARPELADFAAEHWLANLPRMGMPPEGADHTSRALLDLSFNVLSPARHKANGKIGLRWTRGGFGTPFFGQDEQLRVEGATLIRQRGTAVESIPITTLRAAAEFAGIEPGGPPGIDFHDAPPPADPDADLDVVAEVADYIGQWYGFGNHVLELFREEVDRPDDTRVQLWPEHFDLAMEWGDADAGGRASFGASPGDDGIPMPYFYVAPWAPKSGDYWNAPFGGAALPIDQLIDEPDQVAAALDFFRRGRSELG